MSETQERPLLEWGWAGMALESESGDLHVVKLHARGALVAVINGLGHGLEAAIAARAAARILAATRVIDRQIAAQYLRDTHGKGTDDAVVLVVRHLGRAP